MGDWSRTLRNLRGFPKKKGEILVLRVCLAYLEFKIVLIGIGAGRRLADYGQNEKFGCVLDRREEL